MALWTKAASPRSPRRFEKAARARAAFRAESGQSAGLRPGEAPLALSIGVEETLLKKIRKKKRRKPRSLRQNLFISAVESGLWRELAL
jgi:hypothetical protein